MRQMQLGRGGHAECPDLSPSYSSGARRPVHVGGKVLPNWEGVMLTTHGGCCFLAFCASTSAAGVSFKWGLVCSKNSRHCATNSEAAWMKCGKASRLQSPSEEILCLGARRLDQPWVPLTYAVLLGSRSGHMLVPASLVTVGREWGHFCYISVFCVWERSFAWCFLLSKRGQRSAQCWASPVAGMPWTLFTHVKCISFA